MFRREVTIKLRIVGYHHGVSHKLHERCQGFGGGGGLGYILIVNVAHRPLVDAADIVADPARSLVFPTAEAVAQAFTETGLIGSLYDDYEQRNEQVSMAEAVRSSFARSTNLMVEAGTGAISS